jgi:pullulanase/glycogen debranching enzyme
MCEMHVRGFTRRANSNIREEERGTFAGVVAKARGRGSEVASKKVEYPVSLFAASGH